MALSLSVNMSDRAAMQAKFAELGKVREEILAKSAPMREARDAKLKAWRVEEDTMNAAIQKVEEDLYELDNARGMLARALGGRTGS